MKRKRVEIPVNSHAVGYGLICTVPEIKAAAVNYVSRVIREERGGTRSICPRLDISLSTYSRWLSSVPEIRAVHDAEWRKRGRE